MVHEMGCDIVCSVFCLSLGGAERRSMGGGDNEARSARIIFCIRSRDVS